MAIRKRQRRGAYSCRQDSSLPASGKLRFDISEPWISTPLPSSEQSLQNVIQHSGYGKINLPTAIALKTKIHCNVVSEEHFLQVPALRITAPRQNPARVSSMLLTLPRQPPVRYWSPKIPKRGDSLPEKGSRLPAPTLPNLPRDVTKPGALRTGTPHREAELSSQRLEQLSWKKNDKPSKGTCDFCQQLFSNRSEDDLKTTGIHFLKEELKNKRILWQLYWVFFPPEDYQHQMNHQESLKSNSL